ncbi:hypothetical protein FH972_026664 [Carpinus fangiana]|uniref:O-acyltransferase n=1 Tax=Carpinus fangiana TaxID=176857 RepID=A0A5N6L4N3_9ROSI|nr:hypothetical protein FH972_026664 [Carpinus fangiana]
MRAVLRQATARTSLQPAPLRRCSPLEHANLTIDSPLLQVPPAPTMSALTDTAVTTSADFFDDTNEVVRRSTGRRKSRSRSKSTNGNRKKPSRKYKHVFAIHSQSAISPLTSGAVTPPSFMGFRNLMVLVVLVSNLRLMIENFQKYGVLICVACHDYRRQDVWLGSALFLLVPLHLFVAFAIERAAAGQASLALSRAQSKDEPPPLHPDRRHKRSLSDADRQHRSVWSAWHTIAAIHAVNATANLFIASYVIYVHIHHPGIGTLCELHAVVVWLKVCSYALTNRDLRHAYLSGADTAATLPPLYAECPYPNNITLSNLSYFWWAPTLVYQPVYPRTPKVRILFCIKRFAETVSLSIAIWIASAQYAVPLLRNSLPIISTLAPLQLLERLMKLSSISLFCWLAGFFAIFQSALNLLAELMRFGDRDFYGDWWNSPNLRTYWSSWNKPVYHFMKRHIYAPLVGRGVSPPVAQICVFLFSGVLHEMLVGVPTHNIIGVAFIGMIAQIPLIVLTETSLFKWLFNGPTAGNVLFWVSFVLVGQPLAALIYYFAWHAKYGSTVAPSLWKD